MHHYHSPPPSSSSSTLAGGRWWLPLLQHAVCPVHGVLHCCKLHLALSLRQVGIVVLLLLININTIVVDFDVTTIKKNDDDEKKGEICWYLSKPLILIVSIGSWRSRLCVQRFWN